MRQRQIFAAFVLLFPIFVNSRSSQKKMIILNGFSNCTEVQRNPVHFSGSVKSIGINKYELNGEVKVDEIIAGPVEVIR